MKKSLILLAILLLAGWALWQAGQPSAGSQSLPAWPQPELSKAADIRIDGDGIAVHLQHGDHGWDVDAGTAAVAADAKAVQQLTNDLEDMRPVRVVARDASHDAELHLTPDKAIRVLVKDGTGKVLLDLAVGAQGSDLVTTCVRRAGETQVVAVDRALLWQLKRLPAGWQAPKEAAPAAPEQPAAPEPTPAKG